MREWWYHSPHPLFFCILQVTKDVPKAENIKKERPNCTIFIRGFGLETTFQLILFAALVTCQVPADLLKKLNTHGRSLVNVNVCVRVCVCTQECCLCLTHLTR